MATASGPLKSTAGLNSGPLDLRLRLEDPEQQEDRREQHERPGPQGDEHQSEGDGGCGRVLDGPERRDEIRIQGEPAVDEHQNHLEHRPGPGVSSGHEAGQDDHADHREDDVKGQRHRHLRASGQQVVHRVANRADRRAFRSRACRRRAPPPIGRAMANRRHRCRSRPCACNLPSGRW
jgi:hypothetical protein